MNKLLQKLAEQAERYADYNFKGEHFWSKAYESKFAELIVAECLVKIGEAIPDTNCSASGAYKTARIAATSRVREHFGVE